MKKMRPLVSNTYYMHNSKWVGNPLSVSANPNLDHTSQGATDRDEADSDNAGNRAATPASDSTKEHPYIYISTAG